MKMRINSSLRRIKIKTRGTDKEKMVFGVYAVRSILRAQFSRGILQLQKVIKQIYLTHNLVLFDVSECHEEFFRCFCKV